MPNLQVAQPLGIAVRVTPNLGVLVVSQCIHRRRRTDVERLPWAQAAAKSLLLLQDVMVNRRQAPRSATSAIPRTALAPVRAAMPALVAGAMILLFPCARAADVLAAPALAISAELQPDRITLGQSAHLVISLSGTDSSAQPRLPHVEGLRFKPTGRSSQIRIVDGEKSSRLKFSYHVSAIRPGEFEIPGIAIDVAGRTLESESLTLRVVASGKTAPGATNASGHANTPLVGRTESQGGETSKAFEETAIIPEPGKSDLPGSPLYRQWWFIAVEGGLMSVIVAASLLLIARQRRQRRDRGEVTSKPLSQSRLRR